jgi:diguanylate cyclase (GGDEF)-like protein
LTHWTQVLANVVMVEFVALAALTAVQWLRHRIRGAGWAALSFAILGGISVLTKVNPAFLDNETALMALIASLMLMPYCVFRFAASFQRPARGVRYAAALMTAGIIGLSLTLQFVAEPGYQPPLFALYRAAFCLQFAFIFCYVVLRLFRAGAGEPRIAAARIHLLAVAVAGLEIQVVLTALGITGATVGFADEILMVAMGLLFLAALVLPSFVRLFLSRHEDQAFRRGMTELVTAGRAKDVAEGLLPHVCALVGASKGAIVQAEGTVMACYPALPDADDHGDGDGDDFWNGADDGSGTLHRVPLRTQYGDPHELVVVISPYMPYFGTEELRKLDQLADMLGLAIERCEMAEQMAYQASHDTLTGLTNRVTFVHELSTALTRVGRRSAGLAVMFIDLDRFKLVNDRADHSTGDTVLRVVSQRLAGAVRRADVVARFGGDEFVAFAEVNDESEAVELAERFRAVLAAPVLVGDTELALTASVGVVVTGDYSDTSDALLHDADTAMYEAKHAGRDQVVLFRSTARTVANARWGLSPTGAEHASAG